MKKYRPSNGTEGMGFEEKFCMQCIHCDPNPEGKKQYKALTESNPSLSDSTSEKTIEELTAKLERYKRGDFS